MNLDRGGKPMGLFDFLRRPGDELDEIAIEIDIEAGVLQRCPICHTVSDRQRDDRLPAAEAIAHARFDAHDASVAPFNGDRSELLARLRSVRERFGYNCLCQEMG
jgi:hypothetical protein